VFWWDCCAGTGNLLAFLKNKERIFASTLNPADVQAMKEQIVSRANLLEKNVFQFDFLNDSFFDEPRETYDPYTGNPLGNVFIRSNLPQELQNIIKSPTLRKKLVIYINPPYAEAGNARTITKTGKHKALTTTKNATYEKYRAELGKASNERFESHFMSDFIAGKIKITNGNGDLFNKPKVENGTKCKFSPEAQAVFDAGRELWRYYLTKDNVNVNASLYDIREYFQGRNEKTQRMNNTSTDEHYNKLMNVFREKMDGLSDKIAEKVYEHVFLLN